MADIIPSHYNPVVLGEGDSLLKYYGIGETVSISDNEYERYELGEVVDITIKVVKLAGMPQVDTFYTIRVFDPETEETVDMRTDVHMSHIAHFTAYEAQEGI